MSIPSDCLAPDDVVALLAGELDEPTAARIDAHVDGCSSCAELLAAVARSPALVAAVTHRDADVPRSHSLGSLGAGESAGGIAELVARVAPGERIGRYVVREEVGRGGMGVVYAAWDPELDRGVAIKLLRARVHGSAQARARLLREARTIAQLSHRNVITVYDVGEVELGGRDVVYVAMELIDGATLRSWRWQRAHDWRELVSVYLEAARGLHAAHLAGVIHRDFKPGNVMIVERGAGGHAQIERVIVLDFGLARVVAELEPSWDAEVSADVTHDMHARLTSPRIVLGTPGYLAPELQRGGLADERSDQWAFCMALTEALCGAHPELERGSVPRSQLFAEARIPAELRRVLERGLADAPQQRHASMLELVEQLEHQLGARRRRALGLVATGGIAGAALLSLGWWQGPGTACEHAEQQLAASWNDARRAEIVDAFATHGTSWNVGRDGALADLDGFAGRWVALHGVTCEAAQRGELSPRQLDARMACLARAHTELGALVDTLAHADRDTVINARLATAELPEPSACEHEDALGGKPLDPDARAAQAVVHARLAEAHSRERTGHLEDARVLLDEADALARALGDRRTEAEVLVTRASAAMAAGDLDAAERELFAAQWAAEDADDPRLLARAHLELVWLEGYFRLGFDRALDHAVQAADAIARAGGDPTLEAVRLRNLGWTAMQQGDPSQAEQHFAAGLAVLDSSEHGDGRDAWILRGDHGAVLTSLGRHDEAARELEGVRAATEAWLGPEHPELAPVLNNIGALARERGRLAEALAAFERVERIMTAAFGEEHLTVARALLNRGTVLADMGRDDEAEQSFTRAGSIFVRTRGEEHPELAAVWKGIAGVAYAKGELERARELFERALAIELAAYGERHPSAAVTSTNLAMVLVDLGRVAEALPHNQRALVTFRERLGPTHPNLAVVLDGIGFAHEQLGELELAAQSYREAIAIAEASQSAGLPEALYRLGTLELRRGHRDEATAVLERALALRVDAVDADPHFLARTRFALAKLLVARDRARAVALAEAASSSEDDDAELRSEIVAWLDAHRRR